MSAFDAYLRLEGSLDGSVLMDESMARHTSYRIGGPARLFVTCDSLSDLSLVFSVLREEELPWAVIGRGSNLLVADEGYDGAIIVLGPAFSRMDFGQEQDETVQPGVQTCVTVGAGAMFPRVVQRAFARGLSGLEFAVGIPGTLGGALFMNAGSRDAWIGGIVCSVTSYVPGVGLKLRRHDDIEWGYRKSSLPAGEVILEASLRLVTADAALMRSQMESSRIRRQAHQPLGLPSCGSVFKNPEGASVGKLIESCGLKGTTCGGAQVSEKHANFIVNTGSATALDVLKLIHQVRDCVKEEHGIELKPEVRFLGFPQ